MAATKLISLARLSEYDAAIKKVITDGLAKKYETITYDEATRVISFYKGTDTTGAADFTITLPKDVDITGKADKVTNATAGHVATLDANGNLVDGAVALADLEKHADLAAVAESGKAADVTVEDAANKFTGATVEAVLAELQSNIESTSTNAGVTVEKLATATDGFLSSYVVKQNVGGTMTQVGATIDIPKDFVVKNATVATATKADTPVAGLAVGDKYIDLEINVTDGTADSKHLYIKATDLAPVYKGSTGTEITVAVAANGTISAEINSVNGADLQEKSVAKTALAEGVQTSLGLADTAVQPEDLATVATTGNAADVAYKAESAEGAGDGKSVAAAIADLEAAVGEGGSVASQIKAAVEDLDSSAAADDGYALTGVTITDGKITAKTQTQFMKAEDYSIATADDIAALF